MAVQNWTEQGAVRSVRSGIAMLTVIAAKTGLSGEFLQKCRNKYHNVEIITGWRF